MEDNDREYLEMGDKIVYNKEANFFKFEGNEVYFDPFDRPYIEHENT